VPETIIKSIEDVMLQTVVADSRDVREMLPDSLPEAVEHARGDREAMIARLEKEMLEAAEKLEFELAATLRDRILEMRTDAVAARVSRR
jgi:excinuclease ABC subunit B